MKSVRSLVGIFTRTSRLLSESEVGRRGYLPAAVKGRSEYLPGGDTANLPERIRLPEWDHYPKLMQAVGVGHDDVMGFAKTERDTIHANLRKYHAVVLRGVPIDRQEVFLKFLNEGLGYRPMDYVGGLAIRDSSSDGVYMASAEPPEFNIEQHNEMASSDTFPTKIAMYCEEPAEPGCGGECALAKGEDILRDLDDSVLAKFVRLGCMYHRHLPDKSAAEYLSWQKVLCTDDRDEVDKYLTQNGWRTLWSDEGHLSMTKNFPALRSHPQTGDLCWFNQIQSHHASFLRAHPTFKSFESPDTRLPFTTFYGDGSEIETEVLNHVREVTWKNTIGFQLQKNDVLIFDNFHMQHARLSFTGKRRILVLFSGC